MDFDTRYQKLNAQQRQAVDTIEGPLMVVAGPGTGKTELLSMRAANILKTTDTLPENILCLTFTESGANAMRKRLGEIIGPAAYKVAIHTFHSFGTEVINQFGEYFYHGADFRPASELSSYELLHAIFESLDLSSPLASNMNGEFTYLPGTLATISDLKKSGLTSDELLTVLDANEQVLDAIEPDIAAVFSQRISKSTAEMLRPIATRVAALPEPTLPPGISPLSSVLAISMAHAVDEAEETNSTKPITAWKNSHLERSAEGDFVFKDRAKIVKLRAVSYLYYQYLLKMQESELYDFDDMVLKVVHAMEVFPELRLSLQERYLYIMVDEFQDTNLAQGRILYNLTNGPFGDAPNIMVVGDDDQAIYSFQGAEVGNILSFKDRFENLSLITLKENYRSSKLILEKSREVITLGEDRLERYVDEVDKSLSAQTNYPETTVLLREYQRIEDERRGVASDIKAKLDSGVPADSITVLARRHHELMNLLPYLREAGIDVNYERRDDVLETEVIQQLILLSKIVCYLADGRHAEADALLPKLLAHSAWGFEAKDIWKLSLAAYKNRSGWLEEMGLTPKFVVFHAWIIENARLSVTEPAELLIDRLIGSPEDQLVSDVYSSPLYGYYFSSSSRSANPSEYLVHLEALRTIRAKLREYRPNHSLKLEDVIEFVELHRRTGTTLSSIRVRSVGMDSAINLMTAHKSKGLEFDHVYIIGAIDSSWGERVRTRSRLISYPDNLQIQASGESMDERLRLFFVAMTRARHNLTISYSLTDDNAKNQLPASFLTADSWEPEHIQATDDVPTLVHDLRQEWYQPYIKSSEADLKQLLAPLLESYRLSPTHLNAFLDVGNGGPQAFLVNNLLRFPSAKGPDAMYGTAIHKTLQRAHAHLQAMGKPKPVEDVLQDFEKNLEHEQFQEHEFSKYLLRGQENLATFLSQKYDEFTPSQVAELNFASQQSRLDTVELTGALDLVDLDIETKTMIVTDYKTGKPARSWKGKDDWEKIKLHKYRQQLLFYKLLVENSRDFSGYTVSEGRLAFVEPDSTGRIHTLSLDFEQEEIERFTALVAAIYSRIINLDLPDVNEFETGIKGMVAFEDWLIDSAA